jgi:hypothetical protein
VKRRLLALIFALGFGAIAPLTVAAQGAHAKAEDHIWYCAGVDPPVDISYCQHNPFANMPNAPKAPSTPKVPNAPKAPGSPVQIPVPVPSI